jgi:hypothetical protein
MVKILSIGVLGLVLINLITYLFNIQPIYGFGLAVLSLLLITAKRDSIINILKNKDNEEN